MKANLALLDLAQKHRMSETVRFSALRARRIHANMPNVCTRFPV